MMRKLPSELSFPLAVKSKQEKVRKYTRQKKLKNYGGRFQRGQSHIFHSLSLSPQWEEKLNHFTSNGWALLLFLLGGLNAYSITAPPAGEGKVFRS